MHKRKEEQQKHVFEQKTFSARATNYENMEKKCRSKLIIYLTANANAAVKHNTMERNFFNITLKSEERNVLKVTCSSLMVNYRNLSS